MAKTNFSYPIIYPDLKIGTIDFKLRQIIQSRKDDMIMHHEIKPIYFSTQQKINTLKFLDFQRISNFVTPIFNRGY